MARETYPSLEDVRPSHTSPMKDPFPGALVEELQREYPLWSALHEVLRGRDLSRFWGMLRAYHTRLSAFSVQDMLDMENWSHALVLRIRAQRAVKLGEYIQKLTTRFPGLRTEDLVAG